MSGDCEKCHEHTLDCLCISMPKSTIIKIPIKTVSEANRSNENRWIKKKRRQEHQVKIQNAFSIFWSNPDKRIFSIKPPFTLILTRIAPRFLDDDNLASSFKYIRDFIMGIFFPEKITTVIRKGKKPYLHYGHCDNVQGVSYLYKQEKGKPKEYAIRIEII